MSRAYKIWLLVSLYLAQGLPFGFFTQALPVMLRDLGYSLTAIGATGFLFLPWALKFLWAPCVDALGTRRAWLLPLQLAAIGGSIALASVDPASGLVALLVAMFAFNLIAATQDIATDGLAVNLLTPKERGLGNGIQVGAYRIGMMLGGGLLLWVFAKTGLAATFVGMAALLALCLLPTLLLREPPAPRQKPASPLALATGWLQRLRQPGITPFLMLICCYKFGDAMGASLVGPYMRDAGMSKETIALVKGSLGSGGALLGAVLGGWLAFRFGRRPALLGGGLLQTLSLVLYALSALGIGGHGLIAVACVAEHVLGGIAVVALFTLMMDASDPRHAGTDYTLMASAIVVSQGLASLGGGIVGDLAGFGPLFMLSVLLSGAGCLLLVRAIDRGAGPDSLRAVWPARAAIPSPAA